MSRKNWLVGALLLLMACNGDLGRLAQRVINEVKGAPQTVSSKIVDGIKRFWTQVQTVPTTVTTAIRKLPSRGNHVVKRLNQRLLAYKLQAFKFAIPADALSDCTSVGLSAVGDAYCDSDDSGQSIAVFCADDGVYALAAHIFDANGACAELDDQIDIATPPTTLVDDTIRSAEFAADSGSECPGEDEGVATCQDTYAVVCLNGKLMELDCASWTDGKERATCGVLAGGVTCGYDE